MSTRPCGMFHETQSAALAKVSCSANVVVAITADSNRAKRGICMKTAPVIRCGIRSLIDDAYGLYFLAAGGFGGYRDGEQVDPRR